MTSLKILYFAVQEWRLNRVNPTGRISDRKGILNTLAITYGGRVPIN
jgi:hypothetical protein